MTQLERSARSFGMSEDLFCLVGRDGLMMMPSEGGSASRVTDRECWARCASSIFFIPTIAGDSCLRAVRDP
jgi:hypothetical protein